MSEHQPNTSNIADIWQQIEAWYAEQDASHLLHPPASHAEIVAVENALGLVFPDVLRESLCRHNGSVQGGWPYVDLLSLEDLQSEWNIWNDLLKDGVFDDIEPEEYDQSAQSQTDHSQANQLQTGWWRVGWIPLDSDGGGNGHMLDTEPAETGQLGQVLFMDHEQGPEGPIFSSLNAYLTSVLNKLQSGQFVYDKQNDCLEERSE